MTTQPLERTYKIGTIARLTGVSIHALRVWERRYQVIEPARTPGGDRLYGDEDLLRIRLLKQLTDQGHSIGQIARLPTTELKAMAASGVADPDERPRIAEELREKFLMHIENLNGERAFATLVSAQAQLGRRASVLEVVRPVTAEIGRRWASGEFRIVHEHIASATMKAFLGFLEDTGENDSRPVAVVATPAKELHELGALMAAQIAATQGWEVVYLGANSPASEITHAAKTLAADAVLISTVNPANDETRAELSVLVEALPEKTALFVGGAAAPDYRAVAGESAIIGSLEALATELKRP